MTFSLSPEIDNNKIFLVNTSKLEGRLDPSYNLALIKNKIHSVYPKYKIGQLSKSLSGGTPSKANLDFWTGTIPWVSPKDMKSFYLSDSIDHITEEAVIESSTNIVPKDTVLLVVRSGILQHTIPIAITTREMAINQDIKALIFNETILPAYAAYFIDVYQTKLLPLIVKHSTTVQSINTEQFDGLKIPVPPKEIQVQIIKVMNASYGKKKQKEAEAQQLLDSIDDYLLAELGIELPEQEENTVQSRIFTRQLSEVSGTRFDTFYFKNEFEKLIESLLLCKYEIKSFYSFITYISSGATPLKTKSEKYYTSDAKNGVPLLRVQNITDEGLKLNDVIFINRKTHEIDLKRSQVFQGDLLITITGRIASSAVAPRLFEGNINQHSVIIRTKEQDVINEYLAIYFNSYLGQNLALRETTGATRPALDYHALKSIKIPLPPIKRQLEIVNHVNQIRTQAKNLQQQAKAELELAKKQVEAMILGEA